LLQLVFCLTFLPYVSFLFGCFSLITNNFIYYNLKSDAYRLPMPVHFVMVALRGPTPHSGRTKRDRS